MLAIWFSSHSPSTLTRCIVFLLKMAEAKYVRLENGPEDHESTLESISSKRNSHYSKILKSTWPLVCTSFLAGMLTAVVAWRVGEALPKGEMDFLSECKR